MKKFVSVREWRDLTDRHLYHEGDLFPFDGREVPADRLQELESGSNRAGLQMIQGIADQTTPEAPEGAEKAQETQAEKPKARKPRKPKTQE